MKKKSVEELDHDLFGSSTEESEDESNVPIAHAADDTPSTVAPPPVKRSASSLSDSGSLASLVVPVPVGGRTVTARTVGAVRKTPTPRSVSPAGPVILKQLTKFSPTPGLRKTPPAVTPQMRQLEEERAKRAAEEQKRKEEERKRVFAPKIRLDENGNMVLDEESLNVTAVSAADENDFSLYTRVTESGNGLMGSSNYMAAYSKNGKPRARVERWNEKETQQFYEGLRVFGTNFALISGLFGGSRDRKQIKSKYRKEQRDHPDLVKKALASRIPLSVKYLEKAGVKLGEKEEEQKEDEEDEVLKDIVVVDEKKMEEDLFGEDEEEVVDEEKRRQQEIENDLFGED